MTKNNSNLFVSWRQLKRMEGKTLTDALSELNESKGTAFKVGRFSAWESGEKFPRADVFRHIYSEVLPSVLTASGISKKEICKIMTALCLPDRVDLE